VSFPINATSINVAGTNYTFPAKTFGWIGDLYIDNDLVIESLKNTSGDIKDMLDSLLKEMSEATDGMWNFQCRQDDSDKYRLIIVDGNLMNSPNGGIDPLNLPYHGPDSVFLNASFNFDIPKGMANRIVMQRANKDKVSEQPGLRGLFSNNTDIVITDDFIAEETKDDSSKKPLIDEEKEKLDNWKGFRQFSRILVQPIISRLGVNTIGQDISDYLVPGNCSNNELFNALRKQGVENGQLASSSPLPLKINFTVMGISGFQFGDMLIIDGLPSQYTSGNGAFMVTEITHKVDDSMWTTDVEAMFRPYMKP
jgi:hypothetical protein